MDCLILTDNSEVFFVVTDFLNATKLGTNYFPSMAGDKYFHFAYSTYPIWESWCTEKQDVYRLFYERPTPRGFTKLIMNFLKIDIIDYNTFLMDYLELLVETQNCLYYYITALKHAKTVFSCNPVLVVTSDYKAPYRTNHLNTEVANIKW